VAHSRVINDSALNTSDASVSYEQLADIVDKENTYEKMNEDNIPSKFEKSEISPRYVIDNSMLMRKRMRIPLSVMTLNTAEDKENIYDKINEDIRNKFEETKTSPRYIIDNSFPVRKRMPIPLSVLIMYSTEDKENIYDEINEDIKSKLEDKETCPRYIIDKSMPARKRMPLSVLDDNTTRAAEPTSVHSKRPHWIDTVSRNDLNMSESEGVEHFYSTLDDSIDDSNDEEVDMTVYEKIDCLDFDLSDSPVKHGLSKEPTSPVEHRARAIPNLYQQGLTRVDKTSGSTPYKTRSHTMKRVNTPMNPRCHAVRLEVRKSALKPKNKRSNLQRIGDNALRIFMVKKIIEKKKSFNVRIFSIIYYYYYNYYRTQK